ncbi:hypothetical protein K432DRAFT_467283, partial [Lepidopterella palustris CBS 459.81]
MLFALGLLSELLPLSLVFAQSCYFSDGSTSTDDVPCNPNALVSAYCFSKQACLSNGLCVFDPRNVTTMAHHRGTCTESTWQSSACPRYCEVPKNDGAPVFSCSITNIDEDCCSEGCQCDSSHTTVSFSGRPYATIIGKAYKNAYISTPSTASLSPTGTSAGTTSSTRNNSGSGSTAIRFNVGDGVGGLLFIVGVATWYWRRKAKRGPRY